MDKAILKKFAIESRKDLMEKIKNIINTFYVDEDFKKEQKGDLYILSNEKHSLSLTLEEYKKRELLIKRIKELSLEQVIEEAAYTWFNRIIAIRYMEINDMLPLTKDNQSLGIRVLSSKDNTPDPEILKFTNLVNPDLDIDFKKEKYAELRDDNEKFKYVLLLVCKKLGRAIPQVFDGITDYIDILIPDNLLNDTGFITKVINEVPENNYNKVEIIGWLYQYYNQIEKDRVISAKKTYKKNEIAYATQLFTPDWIVKYMVENTLGKYWIEHNGNIDLCDNWKYVINGNIKSNSDKLNPTEISFLDPCCGSGHILVYAFEVFYQIYLKSGYNKNDIPELILKNNLNGLDIDDRAGQLSILSVLLKAREYDKKIFNKRVVKNLNIMSIQESNSISNTIIDNIFSDIEKEKAKYLIDNFKNVKEIGSLLLLDNNDYNNLEQEIESNNTIFGIELRNKLIPIIKIANILTKKYDIVVTNPPYLGNAVMPEYLKNYILKNYNLYKSDTFSSFIKRNSLFLLKDGYMSFMTPYVWMFIQSYEGLRKYLIDNLNITSLIQFEYSSFEEATVPICSFTIKKSNEKIGNFFRLTEFSGGMENQRKAFIKLNEEKKYITTSIDVVKKIPGYPIVYWESEKVIKLFDSDKISQIAFSDGQILTGDNNKYLKMLWEVNSSDIGTNWMLHAKGGEYRKWYGNIEYVVDWHNEALQHYKKDKIARFPKDYILFRKGITWSLISTNPTFGARLLTEDTTFNKAAATILFQDESYIEYTLGLLNSKVVNKITKMINPTLNNNIKDILLIPFIFNENKNEEIKYIVQNNIALCKEDWDMFETSWDFKKHPLFIDVNEDKPYAYKLERDRNGVTFETACGTLELAYEMWKKKTLDNFNLLKKNEEELNKIFIDIYGLQNELTPEVEDKDVTIRKADKEREIKSLISYAVGCMLGRYSLNKDGLIYAGGDFDEVYRHHKETDGGWAGASLSDYKYLKDGDKEIELSYSPDKDNIIPITDEAYFGDDIVERFKKFIKVVYGEETFNENMDFIAETLGKKGTETSEDTIRRYFLNNFFNDHVKIYQKRPIYWVFDSGKKNGFKALVYMHRYNENLVPKVRLDYLHRIQTTYEKLLSDVNYKLTTELSMSDKKASQNRQADLMAKLNEIKEYDERIAHIANQRISIDLDDGVKVNYEKFKDILAKIK